MTQSVTASSEPASLYRSTADLSLPDPHLKFGNGAQFARSTILRGLSKLRHGRLTISDQNEVRVFGDDGELHTVVTVHDPEFYRLVFWEGSLGAAESYLRGRWSCDDLTNLLRFFARNTNAANQMDRGLVRIAKSFLRIHHKLRNNTKAGSRRNIREHYDLGNDFFSLFLDDTMMYSSAIFERPEMSLHQASLAKLDRICRKLNLQPNDHVLEIGTGWGGFAEYAARNFGCRVTTTTISQKQFEHAQQRIKQADLNDRVTLLLKDYRDLNGRYDKLVSIEMIEAVGHRYFDTFFRKCCELLRPDGMLLLQAITMPEQRYRQYLKSVDFIQRYIFPGGCLPSVLAMGKCIASESDMRILHLEDLAPHYARTLQHWRARFFDRIDQVRELGFSERFIRMWEYYFCYCEAAFLERLTGVVQLVLAKPNCHADMVEFSN